LKNAVIIGSGFAGLSAACFMARAGWQVTVLEKQSMPGGRARRMHIEGFTFDMGPSWYWMPDVFERFFNCFDRTVEQYYQLDRLDPSYRIYWPQDYVDIPADYNTLKKLFDSLEPGSSEMLDSFMQEAQYKYQVGINKLVHKPGQSITEFIDLELVKGIFKLDVFTSMKKHIRKHFNHPQLQQLLEFPVLFLGALPENTPALYSLMNYADIKLGTWYPKGGMYKIVEAIHQLATELGVQFQFNHTAVKIEVEKNIAKSVVTNTIGDAGQIVKKNYEADVVIGGADYHFIETVLLSKQYRTYSDTYWDKRVMAPSCLIYYVGLNKKLHNVLHHTLFFDVSFEEHGKEIYTIPQWPKSPLFYVSVTSVSDNSVAPEGGENLFFLIPVAAGLTGDTDELREHYFEQIIQRYENRIGQTVKDAIVYKKSYSVSNFIEDYNAFKGNAYGLANTLMQTAVLKPGCRSKKVENLYYTGQLTVPGPGVPPALISGEVVAKEIIKNF
jgi:phytoene desaturase